MKFGINQSISQTITQLSCIQLETPSSRLWNFWWIKTYTTFKQVTSHYLNQRWPLSKPTMALNDAHICKCGNWHMEVETKWQSFHKGHFEVHYRVPKMYFLLKLTVETHEHAPCRMFFNSTFRLNSCPPGRKGRHYADDMFRCIFVNETFVFWLKFHWSLFLKGPIDNNPALV